MEAVKIWNRFNAALFGLVCKKVRHADHCHDIMQDIYIKVSKNLDKIGKAENINAYLVRMTNNAVIDHYRKEGSLTTGEVSEDVAWDNLPAADDSLRLADCCLKPMINSLPDIYREALIKIELQGMRHKDYALEAGISLSNAKVRVQRAKEKLKETILSCCNYEFDRYGNIVDCQKSSPATCCKS